MREFIHYFFHFGAPLIFAYFLFKSKWKKVYAIFILSMLVDLDHLLANPIFDPARCSINFHPLHTMPAIFLYLILLFPKKTRILAIALLFHMFTDWFDCYMMTNNW